MKQPAILLANQTQGVIPAQAGIQKVGELHIAWIPASAGMTHNPHHSAKMLQKKKSPYDLGSRLGGK